MDAITMRLRLLNIVLWIAKLLKRFGNSLVRLEGTLGPRHTRAKSHDYEIMRAQKKVPKGCPKTPPKTCSVVTDPQV